MEDKRRRDTGQQTGFNPVVKVNRNDAEDPVLCRSGDRYPACTRSRRDVYTVVLCLFVDWKYEPGPGYYGL